MKFVLIKDEIANIEKLFAEDVEKLQKLKNFIQYKYPKNDGSKSPTFKNKDGILIRAKVQSRREDKPRSISSHAKVFEIDSIATSKKD